MVVLLAEKVVFFCRKENMNLIFLTSLCISVSGVKCRENTQSSDELSCPLLKRAFLLLFWTVTSERRQ